MFKFEEAKYMAGTDGSWLMLKLKDITTIHKALRKISESKADSVEFEKFYEKRTNDANSYCWVLLTKLAEAIGEPKEIIYREQIRDIPQKPSRVLVKASDVEDEIKTWSKNGLGWYADIVGESTEHKGMFGLIGLKEARSLIRNRCRCLLIISSTNVKSLI